jgi:cytoskeletal protein RodZ
MNTTRFEVPLALPTPHFDDERTVATARQVKPIGRTRRTENWRKVRTLLPLIVLAMFCGGLGAAAVNYYEDRQRGQAVAHPLYNTSAVQLKAEASPVAIAASATPTPDVSDKSSEPMSAEVKAESTPAAEPQTKIVTEPAREQPSEKPAATHEEKAADVDAAKITRKRRVNPPDDDAVRSTKKGAGRISDIFSGPNPF